MKDKQKNQEGRIDKGFELLYYKLSYRRRFIRTLWMIPWMFLALVLMSLGGGSIYIIIPFAIVLIVALYIQACHNYKKWKAEDK